MDKYEIKLRLLEAMIGTPNPFNLISSDEEAIKMAESFGLGLTVPRDRSKFAAKMLNIIVDDLYTHVVKK